MIRDDATLFPAGELIKAPTGEAWHIVHLRYFELVQSILFR